mgnify:CR=1 FL=1
MLELLTLISIAMVVVYLLLAVAVILDDSKISKGERNADRKAD